MKQFDKRDVAVELLDAAVSEHLDHARLFAAYNLAAVSEELLSKFLRLAGKKDSSEVKIGMVKAMSRALRQCEGEDKTWRKAFFGLKNTIKHMDTEADRYFDANIEANAQQKIGDAVSNLEKLGLIKSPQVRRFDEHRLGMRPKKCVLTTELSSRALRARLAKSNALCSRPIRGVRAQWSQSAWTSVYWCLSS